MVHSEYMTASIHFLHAVQLYYVDLKLKLPVSVLLSSYIVQTDISRGKPQFPNCDGQTQSNNVNFQIWVEFDLLATHMRMISIMLG